MRGISKRNERRVRQEVCSERKGKTFRRKMTERERERERDLGENIAEAITEAEILFL